MFYILLLIIRSRHAIHGREIELHWSIHIEGRTLFALLLIAIWTHFQIEGISSNLLFTRTGSPQEHHVLPYFVEDRSAGQYSYMDFVSFVHKQVLSK